MALQLDLDEVTTLAPQECDRFTRLIDPMRIDEALRQTGTVSLRHRCLPAERERLEETPLAWLFERLASCWANQDIPESSLFHGLRSLQWMASFGPSPTLRLTAITSGDRPAPRAKGHGPSYGPSA